MPFDNVREGLDNVAEGAKKTATRTKDTVEDGLETVSGGGRDSGTDSKSSVDSQSRDEQQDTEVRNDHFPGDPRGFIEDVREQTRPVVRQRNELREDVAAQRDDLEPRDIAVTAEDGQLRAGPSEESQRRIAREQAASQSDALDPDDIEVSIEDDTIRAEPTISARHRLVRQRVAEQNEGIDVDDVAGVTLDGDEVANVQLRPDVEEDIFRDELEEEYPDADIDIRRGDDGLEAEINQPTGLDTLRTETRSLIGEASGPRDVADSAQEVGGATRDQLSRELDFGRVTAPAGTIETAIREPTSVEDIATGVRDLGSDAVDREREDMAAGLERVSASATEVETAIREPTSAEDIATRTRYIAADATADAPRGVQAGAAIAAIPEPTPATETVGLGVAAGAGLAEAARQEQAQLDAAHRIERQSEVEVPDRREPVAPSELDAPASRQVAVESEIETPDSRQPVTPEEIATPQEPQTITSPEVTVPEDTTDIETIQTAEQIGRMRDPREVVDEPVIISPDELVDPDELRQQEMEELRQQVEEQAEFVEQRPDVISSYDPFVFPGSAAAGVAEQTDVTDSVGTGVQQQFGFGQATGQQIGPVGADAVDVTPGVRAAQTQFLETDFTAGMDSALETAQTTEPTAPEVSTEFPTAEFTQQAWSGRRGRRRFRFGLDDDIDGIDPAGDLDSALDEQVEFFVPDPEDVGLSPGDIHVRP